MKRAIILALLACFSLIFASASPAEPQVLLLWETLWAGQNVYAGEFQVWATNTSLIVKICPMYGWQITESHVAVHLNPCDIPTTSDKCVHNIPGGNPIPGHFSWGAQTCPQTDPHVIAIPYDTIGSSLSGKTLYMAVHAVVVQGWVDPTAVCGYYIDKDETAWGGPCGSGGHWKPGDPLPSNFSKFGKSRWGYFFSFQLPTLPIL